MNKVLYYSNYCKNCEELLKLVSSNNIKDKLYFVCIDNRIQKNDGNTYIILNSKREMPLPPNVTKVPALMLLDRGNIVTFGKQIVDELNINPNNVNSNKEKNSLEPEAFAFSGNYGVSSDQYSFLDQNIEELSAKGNGGMRQLHNYSTLDDLTAIETPPDDYAPNTIGTVNMEKLQSERDEVLKTNQ